MAERVVNPDLKTPATAQRNWERWGAGYFVQNRWLRVVLGVSVLFNFALVGTVAKMSRDQKEFLPLVVYQHESGALEVKHYNQAIIRPNEANIQFMIGQFLKLRFERQSRYALARDYDNSRLFLDAETWTRPLEDEDTKDAIADYIAAPMSDEVQVTPTSIALLDVHVNPSAGGAIDAGKLLVEFSKTYLSPRSARDRRVKKYMLTADFHIDPTFSEEGFPINPIGLRLSTIRVIPAFETTRVKETR